MVIPVGSFKALQNLKKPGAQTLSGSLNTEHRILNTEHKIQNTEHRIQNNEKFGQKAENTKFRTQNRDHRIQNTEEFRIQESSQNHSTSWFKNHLATKQTCSEKFGRTRTMRADTIKQEATPFKGCRI